MIELVYEIRRRVPADLKPGIKLANPDMLEELADFYHTSKDVITKTLVKELFNLAGEPWINLTAERKLDVPKQVAKVYRGQTTLVDAPAEKAEAEPAKPVRMYRGQPVG
jgi:hypothetical protein